MQRGRVGQGGSGSVSGQVHLALVDTRTPINKCPGVNNKAARTEWTGLFTPHHTTPHLGRMLSLARSQGRLEAERRREWKTSMEEGRADRRFARIRTSFPTLGWLFLCRNAAPAVAGLALWAALERTRLVRYFDAPGPGTTTPTTTTTTTPAAPCPGHLPTCTFHGVRVPTTWNLTGSTSTRRPPHGTGVQEGNWTSIRVWP